MLHYNPYFDEMLGLDDVTNNTPAKYKMPNWMQ